MHEYKAYLLRLWRETDGDMWRALLVNPNSGERVAFATLLEMVTFLEAKTGDVVWLPALEDGLVPPQSGSNQSESE